MIHISVRTLVEYVFSSGSIDVRFRTTSTLTEGIKAHQKIQKTYKELDQKEVPMKLEILYEDIIFTIDGRCDGLLFEDNTFTIDEIKSTAGDLSLLQENTHPVHWAQAIFYAYMYALEQHFTEMQVQLTYVHIHTEEQKQFKRTYSFKELEQFVLDVIKQYAPYATLKKKHQLSRNETIQSLTFPYTTYRAGQRKLAGAVYKTISEKKHLFAQAPTGIGKTISTIFPSLKAMGEGLVQRLFYLTAKTITRTTAEEAFSLMNKQGLCIHVVTITAKEKICFKEDMLCQKDTCEFANGYYDRINMAVLDILANETTMNRATLETYAQKHKVCPFEFSLDTAYASDVIICDYNYIFDLRVSLKRLFDEQKKQTVLLIDEAHNLVERSREMYSTSLQKSVFLQLQRSLKGTDTYESAKKINQYFLSLKKAHEPQTEFIEKILPEQLVELLEEFIICAEQQLFQEQDSLLLETYFATQNFIRIAKLYDERFVTYVECIKSEVNLKLFCLDPSYILTEMGKHFLSHIYFSATLTPLAYYKNMIGSTEDDYVLSVPSPFNQNQWEIVVQALSTRYHDRERTKPAIANMLHTILSKQTGNYLVFFPSYRYMEDVYHTFMETPFLGQTIMQSINMSEEEREHFLNSFQADNEQTLIGFAVLGGIFSEGVDLQGNRLNGVVIVGVGLPQLCLERNIIKDYFQQQGKNGYDYAYVYPGMNKVAQAGGRLIRSEQDEGIIVLIDDRFLEEKYRSLLPYEWQDFQVIR